MAKKVQSKGKKEKAAKKPRHLHKLYNVSSGTLVRKNTFSPKSPGDFMANHKGRKVCGKTGYTEYSSSSSENK